MLTCSTSSPSSPKTPSLPQNFHFTPQIKTTMDFSSSSSSSSTNRPSPRSLQGPRPTPLKVRKDSYKINKKPPAVPSNYNQPPPQPQQPQPPRPPVIIYTVSPKIIHTNPADFMTLVQRLTGPNSGDPSAAGDPYARSPSAALSPAARFAAIETADKPSPRNNYRSGSNSGDDSIIIGDIIGAAEDGRGMMLLDRPSSIPGILSPVPSSLQPISSSFFSPITSFDPGSLNFLNDLSPGPGFGGGGDCGGGGDGGGNSFLISPSNFLSTPTLPSPGSFWELFGDL